MICGLCGVEEIKVGSPVFYFSFNSTGWIVPAVSIIFTHCWSCFSSWFIKGNMQMKQQCKHAQEIRAERKLHNTTPHLAGGF